MELVPIIVCVLLGFAVSWALIRAVQWAAERYSWGGGNRQFHHSHTHHHVRPVSRLGGIGLAGAFLAVSLLALGCLEFHPSRTPIRWTMVWGALAMFMVGLWDDLKPLGARRKLLLQIVVSALVYCGGIQIPGFKNPFTGVVYSFGMWGILPTIFWLVALTNLINLIDGIDGLAGGIGLMLMGLLAFVSFSALPFSFLVSLGMVGALLAFLSFNFPPAKVYMGDGGAYFLGFLTGVLTIEGSHKGTVAAALVAPIIALGLPIIDTSMAIVRRGLKGLPIFRPDRKHIHHKLLQSGFSRRRAVLILYAFSLMFLLMAFGVFWAQGQFLPLLAGVVILGLFISAGSLGLIRDWFTLGAVVGNSLQLRRETPYVLALSHWFKLEAERCDSIRNLWENFQFIASKLDFSRVTLTLPDGEDVWILEGTGPVTSEHFRHEFQAESGKLEFIASPEVMSPKVFEHLSELAAESWHKTSQRWSKLYHLPIRFDSVLQSPPRGRGRKGVAAVLDAAKNKGRATIGSPVRTSAPSPL